MTERPSPNPQHHFLLRLYVAGETPSTKRTIATCWRLVDSIQEKVELEVIDVLTRPFDAENAGILATPTLSDESTNPPRRLIGDVDDMAEVLTFFGFLKRDRGP